MSACVHVCAAVCSFLLMHMRLQRRTPSYVLSDAAVDAVADGLGAATRGLRLYGVNRRGAVRLLAAHAVRSVCRADVARDHARSRCGASTSTHVAGGQAGERRAQSQARGKGNDVDAVTDARWR